MRRIGIEAIEYEQAAGAQVLLAARQRRQLIVEREVVQERVERHDDQPEVPIELEAAHIPGAELHPIGELAADPALRCATVRIASDSSNPTTVCPSSAKASVTRPVPDPISRTGPPVRSAKPRYISRSSVKSFVEEIV